MRLIYVDMRNNDVDMHHIFFNMRLINVNMQVNYVSMQYIYVDIRVNFSINKHFFAPENKRIIKHTYQHATYLSLHKTYLCQYAN